MFVNAWLAMMIVLKCQQLRELRPHETVELGVVNTDSTHFPVDQLGDSLSVLMSLKHFKLWCLFV